MRRANTYYIPSTWVNCPLEVFTHCTSSVYISLALPSCKKKILLSQINWIHFAFMPSLLVALQCTLACLLILNYILVRCNMTQYLKQICMFWFWWPLAISKDQVNSYKMDKTLSVKIIDCTNLEIPSREHCRIGKINSHNCQLIEFCVPWAALVLARCQLPVVGTGNAHHAPVFEGFQFPWLTGAWRWGGSHQMVLHRGKMWSRLYFWKIQTRYLDKVGWTGREKTLGPGDFVLGAKYHFVLLCPFCPITTPCPLCHPCARSIPKSSLPLIFRFFSP